MMEVSCREVLREISNYLENDLDAGLRAMLERHFSECRHCTAVLDGTKNVILLSGDERTFALPAGFSLRLKKTLLRRTSQREHDSSKRKS